jgi:hypothetical protein
MREIRILPASAREGVRLTLGEYALFIAGQCLPGHRFSDIVAFGTD